MNLRTRLFGQLAAAPAAPAPRSAVYLGEHRVLTKTVFGQPLYVDSRDLSLSPQLILEGVWEPNVTQALISLVRPGMTIVEIGANIGYYTIILGRLAGPGGSVCAFEGNQEVFDLLTRNISVNGLVGWVKAERMLVCDSCGERELNVFERHLGSGSMLGFSPEFLAMYHDKIRPVRVPAVTLDHYWQAMPRPVDLIKIDAEGSEPLILRGMRQILAQAHLTLVCEFVKPFFANGNPSAEDFLNELIDLGFALRRITAEGAIVAASVGELLDSDSDAELVLTK